MRQQASVTVRVIVSGPLVARYSGLRPAATRDSESQSDPGRGPRHASDSPATLQVTVQQLQPETATVTGRGGRRLGVTVTVTAAASPGPVAP